MCLSPIVGVSRAAGRWSILFSLDCWCADSPHDTPTSAGEQHRTRMTAFISVQAPSLTSSNSSSSPKPLPSPHLSPPSPSSTSSLSSLPLPAFHSSLRNANIPGYTGHTHWTRVQPAHSDLPHPMPLTSARTHRCVSPTSSTSHSSL